MNQEYRAEVVLLNDASKWLQDKSRTNRFVCIVY